MSTSDRKAELERKKAKLAALRDSKTKREVNGSVGQNFSAALPSSTNLRIDTEELLKNLGITVSDSQPRPASDSAHQKENGSNINNTAAISPKKQRKLSVCKLNDVNIPPPNAISYSKHTQTLDNTTGQNSGNVAITDPLREILGSPKFITHLEWDDEFSTENPVLPFDGSVNETLDASVGLGDLHKMPLVSPVEPARTAADRELELAKSVRIPTLTEEEREDIMRTDHFQSFFDRASRLMERAMDEPSDIFIDYTGADRDEASARERRQLLRAGRVFSDERWSRRRAVTALDWSPTFPELLLAAYNANEDAPHEPDGVCLIWNLKFQRAAPEYIFHCQSPVTSATLATYHPNLVIGGTYSGQIVLWDNRCSKRTPVQRTQLAATAHTQPVHAVMVAGSAHAHNLISLSSDGKLCAWSLDMLAQPQQAMELTYRQTRTVAALCMDFLASDVNNFLVGAEDGRVYVGSRHGNQAGISEMLEGHQAPVTAVATHPVEGSSLFLTSSFDWSVKLWSMKERRFLYSFDEAFDYVMDVAWSPIHPAMFATVDCTGRLDLWNVNEDAEVPSARTVVDGQSALNKCRFHSTGSHIAAGDDKGRVHLFDLNEHMIAPRSDEWSMFSHTVAELSQLSAEQREQDSADPHGLMLPRAQH